MSQVFSKGRILKALAGGPLTWRLLAAEMGFAMARDAYMRSRLWRLWNHEEYVRVTEVATAAQHPIEATMML